MYKAFSGALSLALALLVLNWALPGLVEAFADVALKLFDFISAIIDYASQNIPAQ